MSLRTAATVTLNSLIIGAAYSTSYFIFSEAAQQSRAAIAFCVGILCYLLTRAYYKRDSETNKLMFRSYRLLVWSVPIALFLVNFHLYFSGAESRDYIAYRSFDELMYFGPFVVAIWPLFLIAFFIGNTLIFIEKLLLGLHLPALIVFTGALCAGLIYAYVRLYRLKQAQRISFNIPLAAAVALAPLITCSYLLIAP
ncbi:MAG: hypothetical protein ACPG4U_03165 [Pseudomonadales bacterium]